MKRIITFTDEKNQNYQEQLILQIINQGIKSCHPDSIIKQVVKKTDHRTLTIGENQIDLKLGRLFILGWGKVSASMASSIEKIVSPNLIFEGAVISTEKNDLKKIKVLIGDHPYPSNKNVALTKHLVKLVKNCRRDDSIICLISGGGSSLLTYPVDGISIMNLRKTTKTLLLNAVEDKEINIIRKHLSQVKGGKLAKIIYPANIYNLIISDDPKNILNAIASGPTVPDSYTFSDALKIIDRYNLSSKLPDKVIRHLYSNLNKTKNETIKKGKYFHKVKNIILTDNLEAKKNVAKAARQYNFTNIHIIKRVFYSNVDAAIKKFSKIVDDKYLKLKDENYIVIAGGEIPIPVINKGRGGRAQHFAAMMIPTIRRCKNSVFAAVASDGNDYIKGISGAIVSSRILNNNKVSGNNLEKHIKNTNSFQLHKMLNSHLLTVAPTETNVSDIFIFAHFGKDKNKA